MSRLLDRIARASVKELRFRGVERAWVAREALQCLFAPHRPAREGLGRQLRGEVPRKLRDALRHRDWPSATAAVRHHYLASDRFLLTPSRRRQVRGEIAARFPEARADAAARAERVLEGRYDLLGYQGLSFARAGQPVDWHFDPVHEVTAPRRFWSRVPYLDPRLGDHKIIWELNRHQHWLVLGRAAWLDGRTAYAERFTRELQGWIAANPPYVGINWASMLELAFRSLSWIWALHLFAGFDQEDDSGWALDLLSSLGTQLDHISRHLSRYFSPNTHLLGEGLALYVAGRVLPEFAHASRWEAMGRSVLVDEATAQVLPDGGHAERSAHYHRYALDFYLLALCVARRTADPVAGRFAQVVDGMASFCRVLADDRGRLPTIGDDDGGMLFPICGRPPTDVRDSLALAAILLDRPDLAPGEIPEEVLWLMDGNIPCRMEGTSSPPASRLYPETGYAVLRGGSDHAVLDVGRHGFLNGGHAHADALSIVLIVAGTPFAVDPGTGTYTMDAALRDRFRSTAMHNTVVVDGREQSTPAGPFQWRTRTDARLVDWRAHGDFCCVEGEHEGYAPLVHRRALTLTEGGLWLVIDHLLGRGTHRADIYWHLAEGWSRGPEALGRALVHPDGTRAYIVSTAGEPRELRADDEGLGWYAPVYGRIVPAPTLRFSARHAAPFTIVTAIAGAASPERLAIASGPALAERPDGWHRAAVEVSQGDSTLVALYSTRNGDALAPTRRAPHRVLAAGGELVTDARVALLRLTRRGEPLSLHLLEATAASWSGRRTFRIPRLSPAQDLHLDQDALRRLGRDVEARPVG